MYAGDSEEGVVRFLCVLQMSAGWLDHSDLETHAADTDKVPYMYINV